MSYGFICLRLMVGFRCGAGHEAMDHHKQGTVQAVGVLMIEWGCIHLELAGFICLPKDNIAF